MYRNPQSHDTCKKAFCREADDSLGIENLGSVELIGQDNDNNIFVDTFSARDSSMFVDAGKLVTREMDTEDDGAADFATKVEKIT